MAKTLSNDDEINTIRFIAVARLYPMLMFHCWGRIAIMYTQATYSPFSTSPGSCPSGMNFMEMEFTQCRVFLAVNRSPVKT